MEKIWMKQAMYCLFIRFLQQMKNQKQERLENIQFFARANEQIRKICQLSIEEQTAKRRIKKIAVLKQSPEKPKSAIPLNIMKNLIVDYLRAKNLNYAYSVFMRQSDLLSEDIISKAELASFFQLGSSYSSSPFNITIIELILEKIGQYESNRQEVKEFGVQIELVKNDKTLNSAILSQVQISSIRKEVQEREKKHYESLLASMKKSLGTSLKQQAKRQYELKMKEMRTQYERQVNVLKQKNKEFLVGNPKINPKVEEYLKKIEDLQQKNMTLSINQKEMQKEKISHNCYRAPKIAQKQKQLNTLKKDLQNKKQEYEFALKTLYTSTQDIASKKQKVGEQPKQTDLFLADLKNRKNTKDYMIDQMHGRMLVMDRRIQALSNDNQNIRELNRQLTSKVAQIQEINKKLKQVSEEGSKAGQKIKILQIKPKMKSVLVGVSPDDFRIVKEKKENVIDQLEQSNDVSDSGEDDQAVNRQTKIRLKIHEMDIQMQRQKNKLKLFLDDFE